MLIFYIGLILISYSVISYKRYNTTIGFLFVFLIMGFQSGVAGDYDSYKGEFESDYLISSALFKEDYFWVGLNMLFKQFSSFPVFVCILSAIECLCIKLYVDRFADKKYNFICAILFFFTFNFMLMQMKAMRQGLAVELSMISLIFIDNKTKKSIILAILFSVMAYYSHHSSIIAIIIIWGYYLHLNFVKEKHYSTEHLPFILTCAGLLLYIIKKTFLLKYLVPLATIYEEEYYAHYLNEFDTHMGTMGILPLLYDLLMIYLLVKYIKHAKWKDRYFVIVAIIGMYMDILLFSTGTIQRLLLYFSFINLILYPGIIHMIDNNKRQIGRIAFLGNLGEVGRYGAFLFVILLVGYALKTSMPAFTLPDDFWFKHYKFIFM